MDWPRGFPAAPAATDDNPLDRYSNRTFSTLKKETMINRILIRIKVVQLLYSYLLTQTEFRIDSPEETTSNDKKFAYAVYLDFLLLIMEISGVNTRRTQGGTTIVVDKKLQTGKLAKALAADPSVRQIIFKNSTDIDALRPLAQHLHDVIVESAVYKDYRKKRTPSLADEVDMWTTVVESIFAKDAQLDAALRQLPGYSNVGFKQGIAKVVSSLKSYYGASAGYLNACQSLEESLNKAYELYHSIFVLILEITREQERRLETAKNKHLATADERNPNLRFVENAFVKRLSECASLEAYVKNNPVSWDTDIALVSNLLNAITGSKIYADYMAAETTDYAADCEFWRNVLRFIIFPGEELSEALEDKSVFWNDDLPIMGTFVLKTIKQAMQHPDAEVEMLPQYKDDEDARFGAELFVDSVKNRDEYRALIDRFINTGSWDPERLAFMDIVILTAAISELLNYPNVPVAVTMNEYIEMANNYSSPKSGQFVNGVLYNVVNTLREEGRIAK